MQAISAATELLPDPYTPVIRTPLASRLSTGQAYGWQRWDFIIALAAA